MFTLNVAPARAAIMRTRCVDYVLVSSPNPWQRCRCKVLKQVPHMLGRAARRLIPAAETAVQVPVSCRCCETMQMPMDARVQWRNRKLEPSKQGS